jgi:hypothetical protein
MSNKNKSNYTPFSIYQKRKMAEEGSPLKSIYAKNHNMFSKGVGHLRAGLDSGFELAEGQKRKKPPAIVNSPDESGGGAKGAEGVDLSNSKNQ